MEPPTKQSEIQKPDAKQLLGTILTLANTMMGAALLSLPFTFSRLGYIIAILIALFSFVFSYYGFQAIIDAAHFTQCRTMRGMITQIFGKYISTAIDACIALMYCGFLVSYVSICGDYIKIFVQAVGKLSGDKVDLRIVKACLLVVLAPLTALSSTTALSNVSAFAIIFIIVTVISVAVFFFMAISKGTGLKMQVPYPRTNPVRYGVYEYSISDLEFGILHKPMHTKAGYAVLEVIQRIPLFMPLFGCHASVPVLLHDLEGQPQYKRNLMKKAIAGACVLVFVLYMINALCSYFLFGKSIAGNVLVSFLESNYVMTAVRLCYAIVIIMSFVVIVYPIRSIFMEWMNLDMTTRKGKIAFYIIGIVLTIFAIGISILVPDIVTVFNAVSALFGIAVYWVIPIISRWKNPELEAHSTVPENDDADQQRRDTMSIKRMSFLETYVNQTRLIDGNWFLKGDRVRSRSEILHEIMVEDARHRSQTLQSYQVNMENVVHDEHKRASQNIAMSVKNFVEQTESTDDNNENFEVVDRYRSRSVAEQNPAKVNDEMAELAENLNVEQEEKKDVSEDSIAIACALAAIEDVATSQIKDDVVHESYSLAWKDRLMEKMTRKRATCMIVSCVIVIAINLIAFVLTTFLDMSGSKFTEYEGYPAFPKVPNVE